MPVVDRARLIVWHCWSKSTSSFYHRFYIYVPWTDSISILVTSVHNVSFVLQCIAALFLKCFYV